MVPVDRRDRSGLLDLLNLAGDDGIRFTRRGVLDFVKPAAVDDVLPDVSDTGLPGLRVDVTEQFPVGYDQTWPAELMVTPRVVLDDPPVQREEPIPVLDESKVYVLLPAREGCFDVPVPVDIPDGYYLACSC